MQQHSYIIALFLALALLGTSCSQAPEAKVEQKSIIDAVFASGFIATTDEYLVMANTEGHITQRMVAEGDQVSAGSRLFTLAQDVPSAQLSSAEATYQDALRKTQPTSPQLMDLKLKIEQAETQLAQDQKNYERYRELVASKAVSQLEYEQAQLQWESSQNSLDRLKQSQADLESSLQLNLTSAKSQLKVQQETNADYVINSAIEGRVLNLYKSRGELVRRGEALAKIGGGENIIKLYVSEEDINLVREGQSAYISLNTAKEEVHEARISKIYPAFDEQQQSFLVEATFLNPPSPLYPGTRLQANIVVRKKDDALVIPSEFLQPGDSVLMPDGTTQAVIVGYRDDAWVEITSGLEAGTTLSSNL
ncbi:MAG: HlyD family efflux transporter periplasmic adaptor subunit [Bacteroidota bacterium]